MVQKCTSCGSTNIVLEQGGHTCADCGTVLDPHHIVSELTFQETGQGGTEVIGQYVSAEGSKSLSVRPGMHASFSRDSREITHRNGLREIKELASKLKMSNHHVDAAYRYFRLALQHNFVQGRKTRVVVAACLYMICRKERTPHMLLDFADLLQVNVYVLGAVYLKICRVLHVRLPAVDPSLYLHRYAHRLEFGSLMEDVVKTALKLISRMRRDWMQVGRRPCGLCGAALLIAARIHGFNRTQRQIINVVRICDITLRKRLEEFEDTPSANLTPIEFDTIDLEEEADPPSFTAARRQLKAKHAALEAFSALDEDSISHGLAETNAASMGAVAEESEIAAEMSSALQGGDSVLSAEARRLGLKATVTADGEEAGTTASLRGHGGRTRRRTRSRNSESSTGGASSTDGGASASEGAGGSATGGTGTVTVPQERIVFVNSDGEEFTDVSDDDSEVNANMLTEAEQRLKEQIWTEMNRDYLQAQAEKRAREITKGDSNATGGQVAAAPRSSVRAALEESTAQAPLLKAATRRAVPTISSTGGSTKPGGRAAVSALPASSSKRRAAATNVSKRKDNSTTGSGAGGVGTGTESGPAIAVASGTDHGGEEEAIDDTAGGDEAAHIASALSSQRLSKKINYEVLRGLRTTIPANARGRSYATIVDDTEGTGGDVDDHMEEGTEDGSSSKYGNTRRRRTRSRTLSQSLDVAGGSAVARKRRLSSRTSESIREEPRTATAIEDDAEEVKRPRRAMRSLGAGGPVSAKLGGPVVSGRRIGQPNQPLRSRRLAAAASERQTKREPSPEKKPLTASPGASPRRISTPRAVKRPTRGRTTRAAASTAASDQPAKHTDASPAAENEDANDDEQAAAEQLGYVSNYYGSFTGDD
eukprot:Clim_evm31s151 gene=Clim_evmTU31s151